MDHFEFATNLIRAPFWKRLMDRTFITTVGTAASSVVAVLAIWRTPGVPVNEKIQSTIAAWIAVAAVVGFWNHGNQKKDVEIAKAALSAVPAETAVFPVPIPTKLPFDNIPLVAGTSTYTPPPGQFTMTQAGDDNDGGGPQDDEA